jgi:hypothetical protein
MITKTICAAGAVQLSPPSPNSASPPGACQPARAPTEPMPAELTCKPQAGGTVLSRRNFMNSLVALPIVAAVPTTAPDMAPSIQISSPPHPDAKLIELGAAYERLLAIEQPLNEEVCRLWNVADRLRYEKLGVDPDDREARNAVLNENHSEWMEARKVADKESGYDKAWKKLNQASRKTMRFGKQILKVPAATLTGLLVRARVIETHDEIGEDETAAQIMAELRAFAQRAAI